MGGRLCASRCKARRGRETDGADLQNYRIDLDNDQVRECVAEGDLHTLWGADQVEVLVSTGSAKLTPFVSSAPSCCTRMHLESILRDAWTSREWTRGATDASAADSLGKPAARHTSSACQLRGISPCH